MSDKDHICVVKLLCTFALRCYMLNNVTSNNLLIIRSAGRGVAALCILLWTLTAVFSWVLLQNINDLIIGKNRLWSNYMGNSIIIRHHATVSMSTRNLQSTIRIRDV